MTEHVRYSRGTCPENSCAFVRRPGCKSLAPAFSLSVLRSSKAERTPDKRKTAARYRAEGPFSILACLAEIDQRLAEAEESPARYRRQPPFSLLSEAKADQRAATGRKPDGPMEMGCGACPLASAIFSNIHDPFFYKLGNLSLKQENRVRVSDGLPFISPYKH